MQGRVARSGGAARSSVAALRQDAKMRTQECGLLRGGTVSTETQGEKGCPSVSRNQEGGEQLEQKQQRRGEAQSWEGVGGRPDGRRAAESSWAFTLGQTGATAGLEAEARRVWTFLAKAHPDCRSRLG